MLSKQSRTPGAVFLHLRHSGRNKAPKHIHEQRTAYVKNHALNNTAQQQYTLYIIYNIRRK